LKGAYLLLLLLLLLIGCFSAGVARRRCRLARRLTS
jgi:hypothetical protein